MKWNQFSQKYVLPLKKLKALQQLKNADKAKHLQSVTAATSHSNQHSACYFDCRLEKELSELRGVLSEKHLQSEGAQKLVNQIKSQMNEVEKARQDKDAQVQ